MRLPLIAGNWKMYLDRASAMELAEGVKNESKKVDRAELAVCPPTAYLDAVAGVVAGSKVALGAQNMYHEAEGDFTGETSTAMLCDFGCKYVILGHSERRHTIGKGETDEEVNEKVRAALGAGLIPIVCLGERLPQREAGETLDVVRRQFDGSLAGLSAEQMDRIVIAYEPVWAIGSGKVATPEQAEEVHFHLRNIIAERYNQGVAQSVRILYGGSVKPDNADGLLGQDDIDGALVGTASRKVDTFMGVVAGLSK